MDRSSKAIGVHPPPNPTETVCGPSFPMATRLLASLMVAAVLVWGVMAAQTVAWAEVATANALFLTAVLAVLLYGYWVVLTSHVTVDAHSISQTWLWHKQVRLAEVSQLKLLHVPGLAWLLVPRLVVRSGIGVTTFHAGHPAVLARFQRLAYGEDDTAAANPD